MDPESFAAMVSPMLKMFDAALPEVKETKSEPGKFVEKILSDILKTHPLYPLLRKVAIGQVEEDPKTAEQILLHLQLKINEYFKEGVHKW